MSVKSIKRKIKHTLGLKTLKETNPVLNQQKDFVNNVCTSLDETMKRNKKQLAGELMPDVMANCMLVQLFMMYERYGYKKQRLTKHLNFLLDMWDLMAEPEKYQLTTQEINQLLITETGFDVCRAIQENTAKDDERRKQVYKSIAKLADRNINISEAAMYMYNGRKVRRAGWENAPRTPFYVHMIPHRETTGIFTDEGEPYIPTYEDLTSEDWEGV